MQDEFIIGGFLGIVTSVFVFLLFDVPQDAQVMRQLAKPCLEQGYTKAKCRKMIYIPQSEEMK